MAKLNSRLGYEIKRNELALTNMMKNYDGRKQFAQRLEQVIGYEMCCKVTQALPIILKKRLNDLRMALACFIVPANFGFGCQGLSEEK